MIISPSVYRINFYLFHSWSGAALWSTNYMDFFECVLRSLDKTFKRRNRRSTIIPSKIMYNIIYVICKKTIVAVGGENALYFNFYTEYNYFITHF